MHTCRSAQSLSHPVSYRALDEADCHLAGPSMVSHSASQAGLQLPSTAVVTGEPLIGLPQADGAQGPSSAGKSCGAAALSD